MDKGAHARTPLVLRPFNVPSVRRDGDGSGGGSGDEPVHRLPDDPGLVVPDRVGPAQGERPAAPRDILHIALVIPDIKLYGQLRRAAYLISPPGWKGHVKLHVLPKNPRTTEEEMLYKFVLVDLGLVDPSVAGFAYPDTMELGWSDEPR